MNLNGMENLITGTDTTQDNLGSDQMDVDIPANTTNQFIKKLSRSHIDGKSHGVVLHFFLSIELGFLHFILKFVSLKILIFVQLIPQEVNPSGCAWVGGEEVSCVTENGTWNVGIVLSNGSPRFSSGWNKFVKENELKVGTSLVFSTSEQSGRIICKIQK